MTVEDDDTQIISDIDGKVGSFPGLVEESEIERRLVGCLQITARCFVIADCRYERDQEALTGDHVFLPDFEEPEPAADIVRIAVGVGPITADHSEIGVLGCGCPGGWCHQFGIMVEIAAGLLDVESGIFLIGGIHKGIKGNDVCHSLLFSNL